LKEFVTGGIKEGGIRKKSKQKLKEFMRIREIGKDKIG
jgi:hypothetical protein